MRVGGRFLRQKVSQRRFTASNALMATMNHTSQGVSPSSGCRASLPAPASPNKGSHHRDAANSSAMKTNIANVTVIHFFMGFSRDCEVCGNGLFRNCADHFISGANHPMWQLCNQLHEVGSALKTNELPLVHYTLPIVMQKEKLLPA